MKCPVCKEVNLVMSERQGIEIDYCPECRGVWLDRGELDKIIEKTENQLNQSNTFKNNENLNNPKYFENKNNNGYNEYENNKHNQKEYYNHNNHNNHNYKGKKKESFMSNIFDMFGDD